jgi:hypothetical protein
MAMPPWIRSLADLTPPMKDAADALDLAWSPDLPPVTVAASTVGRAFGGALSDLTSNDIAAVCRAVEMLMTNSDESIRDAIATGFLEALLAQSSEGMIDFRKVAWALGRASREYCLGWDKFTGVETEGL